MRDQFTADETGSAERPTGVRLSDLDVDEQRLAEAWVMRDQHQM